MPRDPAVSCSACGFGWNSATMAEGLRLLGSCPKCDGPLRFRADEPDESRIRRSAGAGKAPHLVLGIPRR